MTMNVGGCEKIIANLANHFSKFYEIVIVSNIKVKCAFHLNNNITYITLDEKDKSKENGLKKIKTKLSNDRTKSLRRVLIEEQPNLVIAFLPEPSIRLLSLKKEFSIPFYIAIRNHPKSEFRYFKWFRNKSYMKADMIILQSSSYAKYFPSSIQRKFVVIPNMIDERIAQIKTSKNQKYIINVGRIVKQKNQLQLIKAFEKLDDKYHEYQLRIYGEGVMEQRLKHYIVKHHLEKRVLIKKNTRNILEKIASSSLLVLSSKYEGMPNALLEAISLKKTIVTTNNSPVIEQLILDKNYIAKKRVKDLTKKMEYALDHPKIFNLNINNQKIYEMWDSIFKQGRSK